MVSRIYRNAWSWRFASGSQVWLPKEKSISKLIHQTIGIWKWHFVSLSLEFRGGEQSSGQLLPCPRSVSLCSVFSWHFLTPTTKAQLTPSKLPPFPLHYSWLSSAQEVRQIHTHVCASCWSPGLHVWVRPLPKGIWGSTQCPALDPTPHIPWGSSFG